VTYLKDKEVAKIAKLIETYIGEHPEASDSIEGITTWWISISNNNKQKELVNLAIDTLISKNVLTKFMSNDGQFIYKKFK